MLHAHLPQEELHTYAQIVSRGVSGRSTQPVQNNLYMQATEDGLRLVATDLEYIHLEAHVPAVVEGQGEVTVPARLLVEVTGSLPPADVTLEGTDQNSLLVQCQKSKYEIRGLPPEDFEMLPQPDGATKTELPQKLLHRILRQTVFAVSRDETRPILTGVQFSLAPGIMEVVATDLYRLARLTLDEQALGEGAKLEVDSEVQAIVSARCLQEVERLLNPDSDDLVQVVIGESLVEFAVGPVKVISRLIAGKFPSYERAVPVEYERVVIAPVERLTEALRRALIVARQDANRVVFHAAGEVMTLTAESKEVGRVEEEVEIELEGEEIEIAFNARYLLDVLEAIDTEKVRFELTGSFNAGAIKPEGDDTYVYVLMPMQILTGE